MSTNDAIQKLKGFIEINGKGLPTKEQWEKIISIIQEADSSKYTKVEKLLPKTTPKEGGILPPLNVEFTGVEDPPKYPWNPNSRDQWTCNPVYYLTTTLNNSTDVKDLMTIDPSTMDSVDSKISETNSVTFRFEADEGDDDDRTNPGRHG